jgi:hypothetical protein
MDRDFAIDPQGLLQAVDLMDRDFGAVEPMDLPAGLPEEGMGARLVLDVLAHARGSCIDDYDCRATVVSQRCG